jgi:hypothetical protein
MARHRISRAAAWLLAAASAVTSVQAAPGLVTVTGGVAGRGNGSIALGCTTFGPVPELSFHSFTGSGMPQGGIGTCGYLGGYTTQTAVAAPLIQGSSLGPVPIASVGNGSQFTGTAEARSSYGALGAAAHGLMSVVPDEGSLALRQMAGAARFADTLTATSAAVGAGTAGSVRYRFAVDGSLSALGAPVAYFVGSTYVVVDVKHGAGPAQQLLNATVTRGSMGTISGNPPPAGWVTGISSLSGGSTFVSRDYAITWGQPWDLEVGLLAWANGSADSSFLGTARLVGFDLFDALHAPVASFGISAASGTDYVNAVPEPQTWAMLLAGLVWVASVARRHRTEGGTSGRWLSGRGA